jgi:SnoaL-like domain
MDLEETVRALADRIDRLESAAAIRNLQHAYGYYLDKCLYEEVTELFSPDGEVVFMGGVYRGEAGIRRLYTGRFRGRFTDGRNGPMHGFLLDHPQLQDVIHLDDPDHARARFRTLMQAGTHDSVPPAERRTTMDQWWEGGLYENRYVRENGVWKIEALCYQPIWHAVFDEGWAHTRPSMVPFFSHTYPEDPFGPDEIVAAPHELWPATEVFPFHYPHPVTGDPWKTAEQR